MYLCVTTFDFLRGLLSAVNIHRIVDSLDGLLVFILRTSIQAPLFQLYSHMVKTHWIFIGIDLSFPLGWIRGRNRVNDWASQCSWRHDR